MNEEINFGIGFITGRPNVCDIINNYYEFLLEQVKELNRKVSFTFFILYDLNYLNTKEEEFYNINSKVQEQIKIKYISPRDVEEKNKYVMNKFNLSKQQADLLIGKGYAKARNTILYEAVEEKIDYLLFWDDDEYPLASVRNGDEIKWIKQKNVLQHIRNIENADITYGYRCGMISPLPYVKYSKNLTADIYKDFIDALENEVISWEKVQCMYKNDSGIGFANKDIANYTKKVEELDNIGTENFVLGSGICLNLRHLEKIPAFYNPPGARGEDTFFSCSLGEKNAKILRIPVYHFHDAFLKFKFLMEEKYPKNLKRIKSDDSSIEKRFKRTTEGWTKYKPLLCYINDKENYEKTIEICKKKLIKSTSIVSTAFNDCDLTNLSSILEEYDQNVDKHYKEYIEVNEIWDKIKNQIREGISV